MERVGGVGFQFHKGTIKTPRGEAANRVHVISIP